MSYCELYLLFTSFVHQNVLELSVFFLQCDIRTSMRLTEDLLKSCWHAVVLMSGIMYKLVKWKGSPAVGWPSCSPWEVSCTFRLFPAVFDVVAQSRPFFCYELKWETFCSLLQLQQGFFLAVTVGSLKKNGLWHIVFFTRVFTFN